MGDESPPNAAADAFEHPSPQLSGSPPLELTKSPTFELTKSPTFLHTASDTVSRQVLIEYVSLQFWSRKACCSCCFATMLWLSFLGVVALHAHAAMSFDQRLALVTHFENITADAFRGMAPPDVITTDDTMGSRCSCACPGTCNLESPNVARVDGGLSPWQVKEMRAKAALRQQEEHEKQRLMKWKDVQNVSDVWFWLQHGFIPDLWHEPGRDAPVDMGSWFGGAEQKATGSSTDAGLNQPGNLLRFNKVIGGIRMRQRRLKQEFCGGDEDIAKRYGRHCHQEDSTRPFGPGETALADGFVPSDNDRSAFDVYFDIGRPVHVAVERIEYMLNVHNWIDDATEVVTFQVPFLNLQANPPIFGLLEVRLGFSRSGSLKKDIDVWTVSATLYTSWLVMIPDIAFCGLAVGLLVWKTIEAVAFCWLKGGLAFSCSVWDIVDWVTAMAGLCIMGFAFVLATEKTSTSDAIVDLPKEAPPWGAPAPTVTSYHQLWGDALDKIAHLVVLRGYHLLAMFWYTFVLILQFFKVSQGQPKLAQLTKTLISAFEDLVHFVLLFLVIFLNFAFGGLMIYGLRLEEWSTPTKALNTSFRGLMGDVDLPAMYKVAPVSTVVWYWLFLISCIFVMLNLLIAITFDHFTIVKERAGGVTGIYVQAVDAIRDLKNRHGMLWPVCGFRCCCRRRDEFPSHDRMLEELMTRAGLSSEEQLAARRSVLGPKWLRKEREQLVFAGELPSDVMNRAGESAEQDFKDWGVDQDYTFDMFEECKRFEMREYDPEALKLAQLRELTMRADNEMTLMRLRVVASQECTKGSMHSLCKRLESLEMAVHSSLMGLAEIANDAGVPDKTEVPQLQKGSSTKSLGPSRNLSNAALRVAAHVNQDVMTRHKHIEEQRATVDGWSRANQKCGNNLGNTSGLRLAG